MGNAIRVKHGFAFKGKYFADAGTHIVLTPGNFHEKGGFRLRPGKDRYYNGEIPDGYILDEGDLIIAMTEQGPGLLGSSALIPEGVKCLHNQRLGLVEVQDESVLDKRFLYHLFNTKSVRAQITASATGTKVRHTAPERIYGVSVSIPSSVDDQRWIGEIISTYDEMIENNRQRILLLERAARLLYEEWFIHLRFPGYDRVTVSDGIPEGWERKPLGKLVEVNGRKHNVRSLPSEVDYIDIASVSRGRIMTKKTMSSSEAPGRAKRIVESGDVIWSNVRPNLCSYALVLDPGQKDVFSTGFTVLSPRKISFSYLYLLITTDQFVSYLVNQTTGVSYPAVRSEDFARATVLLPSGSVMKHFHRLAAPLFRLVSVLEQKVQSLQQARDLLLPRLMNGELLV